MMLVSLLGQHLVERVDADHSPRACGWNRASTPLTRSGGAAPAGAKILYGAPRRSSTLGNIIDDDVAFCQLHIPTANTMPLCSSAEILATWADLLRARHSFFLSVPPDAAELRSPMRSTRVFKMIRILRWFRSAGPDTTYARKFPPSMISRSSVRCLEIEFAASTISKRTRSCDAGPPTRAVTNGARLKATRLGLLAVQSCDQADHA